MDRVDETRRGLSLPVRIAAVAILTLAASGVALAAPVTFDLQYATTMGSATAVGTFTIDDSLLVPNVHIESEDGLDDLLCFNITVTLPTGLPVAFTKADLDGWSFWTDASAVITDANFFMEECGSQSYRINGTEPFDLGLFPCPDGGRIGGFHANPTQGGVCEESGANAVPTLSLPGLVALVLLVGIAAVLAVRRGATLG